MPWLLYSLDVPSYSSELWKRYSLRFAWGDWILIGLILG